MNWNDCRCLVTGGAGFIGSNLAETLAGDGAQVTVLDDLSTGREINLKPLSKFGVDFVHGSILDEGLLAKTFVDVEGRVQPAPAPRFSRTPTAISRPPGRTGEHTDEILSEVLGLDPSRIHALREEGLVAN